MHDLALSTKLYLWETWLSNQKLTQPHTHTQHTFNSLEHSVLPYDELKSHRQGIDEAGPLSLHLHVASIAGAQLHGVTLERLSHGQHDWKKRTEENKLLGEVYQVSVQEVVATQFEVYRKKKLFLWQFRTN